MIGARRVGGAWTKRLREGSLRVSSLRSGPSEKGEQLMGQVRVHEFMSLDGVIDTPTWTMDFGFDPKMGEAIAGLSTGPPASCSAATPTRCSPLHGQSERRTRTQVRRS